MMFAFTRPARSAAFALAAGLPLVAIAPLAHATPTPSLTSSAGKAAVEQTATRLAAGSAAKTTRTPEWTGEIGSGLGSAIAAGSCDVNGDGRDDMVSGAWFWNRAPYKSTGAAYVVLGSDRPQGGVLDDPTTASAVRINGPYRSNASAGFSVACLGDTNGDSLDDIALSGFTDQRVYVVYGARQFESLNLDALGDRGYRLQAPADAGNFGYGVVGLGDINHDGRGDIGVTAVAADSRGRDANGRAWVISGAPGTATVDVSTSPRVLGTIDGARSGDRLSAMAPAGDVNGDGAPDLVLGAYVATPEGRSEVASGAAYVVLGRPAGRIGEVDTAALGRRGFVIQGPSRQRDRLGISVASAGDVNGDGRADLIIGADGVSSATTGPRSGGAAVVYGASDLRTVTVDPTATIPVRTCADTSCSTPTLRGWWIQGESDGDSAGFSVAGIGDVNGDGRPDLALGAYGADPTDASNRTLTTAGKAYVVYGQTAATSIKLAKVSGNRGEVLAGTRPGQRLGRAVAAVGDLDANGRPDVAVGGEDAGTGGDRSGAVRLRLSGTLKKKGTTTGRISAAPVAPLTPVPVPAGTPESVAFAERKWTPTAADTCPTSLHDSYSMVAADGKRYPTWHPARVINPATGASCTFGHEHGDDPRTSQIYSWASAFLSSRRAQAPGIPFGYVSEASSIHHEGHDMRHEDNAGHKVVVANDVPLLDRTTRAPLRATVNGRTVSLQCDYLIKMHQGSHSSDATKNNAHELIYAVRCNDGTQAIVSTLSRIGKANEYTRGCDESVTVPTTGSQLPAGTGGRRLIPDTTCADRHVLVPAGQRSDIWGLYEVWETANELTTSTGKVLASYDPWLAVRNPSRIADTSTPGASTPTLLTRWAVDPADQGIAGGWPWSTIPADAPRDQQWTGSPFNGAQRDSYLAGTTVNNAGGAQVWYSDPYGRDASTTAFHGSVPQLVSTTAQSVDQSLAERVNLGLEDDFGGAGTGVHAPN